MPLANVEITQEPCRNPKEQAINSHSSLSWYNSDRLKEYSRNNLNTYVVYILWGTRASHTIQNHPRPLTKFERRQARSSHSSFSWYKSDRLKEYSRNNVKKNMGCVFFGELVLRTPFKIIQGPWQNSKEGKPETHNQASCGTSGAKKNLVQSTPRNICRVPKRPYEPLRVPKSPWESLRGPKSP